MKRIIAIIFCIAVTLSSCMAGKIFAACTSTTVGTDGKVCTAFGEIDPGTIGTNLVKFGSGLAGGIAFLLIIIGGFQIVMSAGNPEKLNEGKETVTSAIVGLLFIIFAIFLLRLIGVDILGIPGLS